jgi:hypothetical protein
MKFFLGALEPVDFRPVCGRRKMVVGDVGALAGEVYE